MSNINDMSALDKSLAIISLMPDWRLLPDHRLRVGNDYEIALHKPHYLYANRKMWVARLVVRWADQSGLVRDDWRLALALGFSYGYRWQDSLDDVLALSIEAGRVTL